MRCRRSSLRLAASPAMAARAASFACSASAAETVPSICFAWSEAVFSAFATEKRFRRRFSAAPLPSAAEACSAGAADSPGAAAGAFPPGCTEGTPSGLRAFVGLPVPRFATEGLDGCEAEGLAGCEEEGPAEDPAGCAAGRGAGCCAGHGAGCRADCASAASPA